jgi:hypothetical protein
MASYFFHLRDGLDVLLDREGRVLDDAAAIADAALMEARFIISEDAKDGRIRLDQRIDVEDEFSKIVHTLEFVDAIEIVQPRPA